MEAAMTETSGVSESTASLAASDVAAGESSTQPAVDLLKSDATGDVPQATQPAQPTRAITFQSMADRLTLGLLASVIGAVLVFVSAFLTWSTVNARSSAGAKTSSGAVTDSIGIADGRLGLETLVLSLASLALVAVMLMPATKPWAWKVLIGTGALTVLLALIELVSIPRTLRPDNFTCPSGVSCSFHRTVGPGVWFTLVTGLVVIAGAYVHHIRPVPFRPQAAGHASATAVSEPPVAQPVADEPAAGHPGAGESTAELSAEPPVAEPVTEPVAEPVADDSPAANVSPET
jgi:hypothetical protein